MKEAYSGKQLTFEEMKGSLSCLPKDNQWVKLGDSLPWDEFDRLYLRKLRNDGRGAKNLPSRMIIGVPVIKHKRRLSDVDTIQAIRENPYMQYMLGLTEYTDKPIFNFTAGLPIVRTSPDHGTAYDIAGKGIADCTSMRRAIYTAIDIFRNRTQYENAHAHPLRKLYHERHDDSDKLKLTAQEEDKNQL